MARLSRLLAASFGGLALAFVFLAPTAVAADPTGPIGTLTINDASGYTANPTLTSAGHGQATVYVDGVLVGTVDLAATVNDPTRIVFHRHWASSGTHTVRIVVLGTVGRPTVDVDGFAVLR